MVITEDPVSLNVTVSNSFSLSCGASGFPLPDIVWLQNGTEIEPSNITLFEGSGSGDYIPILISERRGVRSVDSRLDVAMAMTNDTGSYSCSIVSDVYPAITTSLGIVLVQGTPTQSFFIMPTHFVYAHSMCIRPLNVCTPTQLCIRPPVYIVSVVIILHQLIDSVSMYGQCVLSPAPPSRCAPPTSLPLLRLGD